MSLRVIGAGLSRTGTLSLKVALERLGFGPCYHAFEYLGAPGHVDLWRAAMDRDDAAIDWDRDFGGYRSAVDVPAVYFWRQLVRRHPDAQVILTIRDPDRWYDSIVATIERARKSQLDPAETDIPDDRWPLIERIMAGLFPMEQYGDRDAFVRTLQKHNEAVQEAVAPEQLLVYRVEDGWAPLTRFLGVETPDVPFPHLNAGVTTHGNATIAATRATRTAEKLVWL